jgi:type IV pilus assembly protein PilV
MMRISKKEQSGLILLEAMVAILIFTIGVIALMGVQAAAMRSTSDSKIRMDAEFFADQLLSEMAIDGRTTSGILDFTRLSTRYDSTLNGPGFRRWRNRVTDTANGGLPGTAGFLPTVTVLNQPAIAGTTMVRVNIVILWRAPNDPASEPARRLVTSSILN